MAFDKTRTNLLLSSASTEDTETELIKLNQRLFWKVITNFGLLDDPEAESLGYLSLLKAIRGYDAKSDTQFSTYATVCIYNALGSYVRTLKTQINVNTVPYDEYMIDVESLCTTDGRILQKCGVDLIMQYIAEYSKRCHNDTQRAILQIWVDSQFLVTNKEVASRLNCSQSYVNQVINKFRKALKNKLGGH